MHHFVDKGLDIRLIPFGNGIGHTCIVFEFPSAVTADNQIVYHDKEEDGSEHVPLENIAVHG